MQWDAQFSEVLEKTMPHYCGTKVLVPRLRALHVNGKGSSTDTDQTETDTRGRPCQSHKDSELHDTVNDLSLTDARHLSPTDLDSLSD